MPKMKTHRGATKRFKLTRTGKIIHRKAGQSHFNSRDNGTTTMGKRRDMTLPKANPRIKLMLPR
jgi:large subunit ribosomal protein L35